MSFKFPVDIGNRALQHCGAELMDAIQGFSENSKNAKEVAFCYDKLRRAELQRNVWTFATRRTALRAIDTETMLLRPSLWSSTTTYFKGSIVADETGYLWISNTASNLGNQPENSLAWEPYFGPLTVSLWDDGTAYFAGELVYVIDDAEQAAIRIFLSLVGDNSDDPTAETAWDATVTYKQDQVVTFSSTAYMSRRDFN